MECVNEKQAKLFRFFFAFGTPYSRCLIISTRPNQFSDGMLVNTTHFHAWNVHGSPQRASHF